MGLDIWFRDDIQNALLAINEASFSTAAAAEGGLGAVALAFGIAPQTRETEARASASKTGTKSLEGEGL